MGTRGLGSSGLGGTRRRSGSWKWWVALAAAGVAALCLVIANTSGRPGSASAGVAVVDPPVASVSKSPPASASPSASAASPGASASVRAKATPARSSGSPATRTSAASSSRAPSAATGATSASPAAAGHRNVTFVNAVSQTIWVGSGEQTAQPALNTTGWVLKPGQSLTVSVPDHWNGRFWGRTGCTFSSSGTGHCQTGDCGGRFQCTGYGTIPATLAEFNLNSWDGLDFYDVSMVDGSNLPMWINQVGGTSKDAISADGCSAAGCTKPVVCPAALQIHAGGAVVGCESPCGVFGTDQYCCRGQWAARSACDPTKWPVDYAADFKRAEPFAYSYVDDDATSTFTATGEAGYRITFGLSP
ncbi:thaumatin family protein [Streptacidiphilus cavernicola]|uniref:Thaumatin family protein n=1 Tax=Streptacidiphilus cavernicola TaxID=3342716 RepID=A0ABV6UJQ3_9ACTN